MPVMQHASYKAIPREGGDQPGGLSQQLEFMHQSVVRSLGVPLEFVDFGSPKIHGPWEAAADEQSMGRLVRSHAKIYGPGDMPAKKNAAPRDPVPSGFLFGPNEMPHRGPAPVSPPATEIILHERGFVYASSAPEPKPRNVFIPTSRQVPKSTAYERVLHKARQMSGRRGSKMALPNNMCAQCKMEWEEHDEGKCLFDVTTFVPVEPAIR